VAEGILALAARLRRRVARFPGTDLPPRGLDLRFNLG
jgi:hypothetical protein